MKKIPPRVIEKVWGKMEKMSRSASTKLMEQMGREQPVVLAYMGSVDEDSLNEGERGLLAFLGIFIWQAMKQAGGVLPQVSEEAMVQAEAATVKGIESLVTEGETDPGGIDAMLQGCGQPDLLDFALAALMEAAGYAEEDESADGEEASEASEDEEDDDTIVRAENAPLLMLNLKTIVDVLNR